MRLTQKSVLGKTLNTLRVKLIHQEECLTTSTYDMMSMRVCGYWESRQFHEIAIYAKPGLMQLLRVHGT